MALHQVTIRQTLYAKATANVMYWEIPDDSPAGLQSFADSLRASYITFVQADITTNWTMVDLLLRKIDGNPPFSFPVNFTSGPIAGLDVGQGLPTTVALLVSGTYFGARPNRSRTYFMGLTEARQGDSEWGSGTIADFQAMANDWQNGIPNGATLAFPRIARVDFLTNTAIGNNPIDDYTVRSTPATIRNRRLGT